jgi:hypothetical protein
MDEAEELSHALMTLSSKILNRTCHDRLRTARDLLLDIDGGVFGPMFERWGCKSFLGVQQAIESYYINSLGEKIRWDSELVRRYSDEFIEVFVFILDLALKSGRDNYIEDILTMDQQCQIALQPFVMSVTQREEFVQPLARPQEEGKKPEHLIELEEENEKLKAEKEALARKFHDLKESYDYLKISHSRLSEEVNFLKQERYQFINELGGSEYGNIEETVDKVKIELTTLEKQVERLQKELDEKKTLVEQREDELREFENNFKANRY